MKHLYSSIALLAVLFAACGKDKGVQSTTVVTTIGVTNINATSATASGAVSNDATNAVERGFCYGLNSNPIAGSGNYNVTADGAGNGTFSANLAGMMPNTLYHYRAYSRVQPGTVFTYGEDKTFTTLDYATLTTSTVTNITAATAHIKADFTAADGTILSYKGFTYSTTHNALVGNSQTYVQDGTPATGNGSYELDVKNMNPNSTYYVRAYAHLNTGVTIYSSNELIIKTVGYPGSAGGYVVLDKGDTTGGWRYLEAAPEDISYQSSGNGYNWGCSGSVISQTSTALGTGPANTNLITAGCSYFNCAARGCADYSINGFSDWFLPSQEEMLYTYTSLYALNIATGYYWTSSELNQSNAVSVFLNGGLMADHETDSKVGYLKVQPVRRY